MILLVDLCYEEDSLSKYEFVYPIADAVNRAGAEYRISHFSELNYEVLGKCDRIILCGTALKDNLYMEHLDRFLWMKESSKPILGLCAGMQVISAVFGGRIVPQAEIGLGEIEITAQTPLLGEPRCISGYHLHNYGATLPQGFDLVAGNPEYVKAFRHRTKPIFGIIFHPEVRNKWIIDRFLHLPQDY